eukprot:TRINITY_DN2907_c0_g2_i1.p1 TRINITY_DN2907_c0_g2~~TRINITY_DN2907_c0_g2_i1.p1  ORF type:complete len:413 (+),score=110.61 TRINITY_DN2907_c0_g2_i1:1011-2249(+)
MQRLRHATYRNQLRNWREHLRSEHQQYEVPNEVQRRLYQQMERDEQEANKFVDDICKLIRKQRDTATPSAQQQMEYPFTQLQGAYGEHVKELFTSFMDTCVKLLVSQQDKQKAKKNVLVRQVVPVAAKETTAAESASNDADSDASGSERSSDDISPTSLSPKATADDTASATESEATTATTATVQMVTMSEEQVMQAESEHLLQQLLTTALPHAIDMQRTYESLFLVVQHLRSGWAGTASVPEIARDMALIRLHEARLQRIDALYTANRQYVHQIDPSLELEDMQALLQCVTLQQKHSLPATFSIRDRQRLCTDIAEKTHQHELIEQQCLDALDASLLEQQDATRLDRLLWLMPWKLLSSAPQDEVDIQQRRAKQIRRARTALLRVKPLQAMVSQALALLYRRCLLLLTETT